jgi:biopolymer transport protein ExbD
MAELDTSGGGKHKKGGKVRGKKMSTRVDMTPMVDLGFLLITFFILTTSFNTPQAMEINMPDKTPTDIETVVKHSCTMNVVLGEDNKVFWWMGMLDPDKGIIPEVHETDYSADGIRKTLLKQGAEVMRKPVCNPAGMTVLIKPMKTSKYKNMVDILDEMKITRTSRFALVDITEDEIKLTGN